MNIRISTLLLALFLTGCATFPDKIKLEKSTKLVSYESATSKAEQVKGETVRWGGAIAKVENKPDSTVFEMVYFPLNGYGRPISDEGSTGRFRVSVNGFMDPLVYQVGRLMTFTGKLTGLENGLIGEHEYMFPHVGSDAYYLWKNVQRIDVTGVQMWPYQYRYGYYQRPNNRRFILRSSNANGNNRIKSTRPSGATTLPKQVKTNRVKS